MTVRELLMQLLDSELDTEVVVNFGYPITKVTHDNEEDSFIHIHTGEI